MGFAIAQSHPTVLRSRAKDLAPAKFFAPPLNNHTHILYLVVVLPTDRAVFLITGREFLLFPVPTNNIPCFNLQGIRTQYIEFNT
jgi:hypothetical protein